MMNKRHKSLIVKVTTAAIAILAIAAAFLSAANPCLVLYSESGEEFAAYPVKNGTEFSISFIHSVNRSEVADIYNVQGKEIILTKTRMSSFGAGVETYAAEGQEMIYEPDGSILLTGFDQPMEDLCYVVGTVFDHYLSINGQKINLVDLCGKNERVYFKVDRRLFLKGN